MDKYKHSYNDRVELRRIEDKLDVHGRMTQRTPLSRLIRSCHDSCNALTLMPHRTNVHEPMDDRVALLSTI